jgi:ABC-type dipeptide/oligopeptide/nickel transport system permease subunit
MITAAFNKGGFVLNLWWWYVAPGIMISLITAGFFLIGMKKKMRRNVWDE